eukprot:1522694-Prymnesium_polylepis.1
MSPPARLDECIQSSAGIAPEREEEAAPVGRRGSLQLLVKRVVGQRARHQQMSARRQDELSVVPNGLLAGGLDHNVRLRSS